MNTEVQTKDKSTRSKIITVVQIIFVVGVLIGLGILYFSRYDKINRDNLEAFVRDFSMWGPGNLALVLVYAVLYIASAPIPFLAPTLSAVGGLLFGAIEGTLYLLVIATISALIPFSLARRLGREWVASKLKGKKLEEIYQQSEGEKGFTFIVLMRLIPVLPWEIQNYVAGLTQVSVLTFILGTMVGIIPGSFSLAWLGAAATDPTSWEFFAALALKIVTALIPVVAIAIRRRRRKQEEALEKVEAEAEIVKS